MTNAELLNAMRASGRLAIISVGNDPERIQSIQLAQMPVWQTIRNDFTGKTTRVDTSRPMTKRRALQIRRRLCSDNCTSGDTLGAHGPQDDSYLTVLYRADRAILTGENS